MEIDVFEIIVPSFMDNLRFLTCGKSSQEIAKILPLVRKTFIERKCKGDITYDIDQTGPVLFPKVWPQNLMDQI